MAAHVVGDRRVQVIRDEDLAPFKQLLKRHAIMDKTSSSYEHIQKLGIAYDAIRESMNSPNSSTSHRRIPDSEHLSRGPVAPPTPQPQIMLRFLRSAMRAIPGSSHPSSNSLDHTQKTAENALVTVLKVPKFIDHRMPFREHGPSYKSICRDGGPFSSDWIHTRAGFFSALIFRGVTFHTPFALEHPLFRNHEEWKAAIHGRPVSDYVDQAAYGGFPNPKRESGVHETVQRYWDMTGIPQNTAWLTCTTKSTYRKFFDFVLRFPQIGTLTAQLLAADYALHGIINMPGTQEMGIIVHKINKGAVGGLIALGFLPANTSLSESDVVKAFESLYGYLDTNLTQDEKTTVNFGPILLENSLCKIGRVAWLKAVKPLFPELPEEKPRAKEKSKARGRKRKKPKIADSGGQKDDPEE
ncbi:hypothetical protein C8R43DRAFT_1067402 [Mycena crocata]|nr:hypothetical protein C8R43DRAFT_1067402 [Mycena crocata]